MLSTSLIFKIALELTLGVCMKLQCDNGRIHWRDLVNDLFFWVPGVEAQDDDGLSREFAARQAQLPLPESAPVFAN